MCQRRESGGAAGVPCVWIDRDRTGEDDVPVAAHLHGMAELPAVLSGLR